MASHLLPRQLRAWANRVPDGRSHSQASAGTARAGVHPSGTGSLEHTVTPVAHEVHIRCLLMGWTGRAYRRTLHHGRPARGSESCLKLRFIRLPPLGSTLARTAST